MTAADDFISTIEAFLHTSKMSPTRFGKEAVGDPGFVFAIRNGRSPSLKVVERVLAFITNQERDSDRSQRVA